MRIACLLTGGPTHRIVDSTGKEWLFEDHPRCGPTVLHKQTENPVDNQPCERSPFWEAVGQWIAGGRKVAADGRCEWSPAKPMLVRHVAGRHHVIVDAGEPGGKVVVLPRHGATTEARDG